MADVTVRTEGGGVVFDPVTPSGERWIARKVVAAHGGNRTGVEEGVDLVHKAAEDGVEVKLVR